MEKAKKAQKKIMKSKEARNLLSHHDKRLPFTTLMKYLVKTKGQHTVEIGSKKAQCD